MQDMKLVEALNNLRSEVRDDVAQLRREVREDIREVREHALAAHLGLMRKLVWAIMVLGLALGGKDILAAVLPWIRPTTNRQVFQCRLECR